MWLFENNGNLAKQTKSEFSQFDRTENGKEMSSLYEISRLKKADDINGDVIISTIQKLFAVLTGQTIADDEDEDKEVELNFNRDNDKNAPAIELGNDLKLPPPIIFSLLSLTNAIGQFMASGNLSLIILAKLRFLGLQQHLHRRPMPSLIITSSKSTIMTIPSLMVSMFLPVFSKLQRKFLSMAEQLKKTAITEKTRINNQSNIVTVLDRVD